MPEQKLAGRNVLIAGAGVVLVGAALIFLSRNKPVEELTPTPAVENTNTVNDTSTPSVIGMGNPMTSIGMPGSNMGKFFYKDGTYTAVGMYQAPSGQETVGVELTIVNGVVTAVVIENQAVNAASKQFQTMFSEGVSAVVVGKSLNELSVGTVSGSSLTPKGFNDALVKIKAEAKS